MHLYSVSMSKIVVDEDDDEIVEDHLAYVITGSRGISELLEKCKPMTDIDWVITEINLMNPPTSTEVHLIP